MAGSECKTVLFGSAAASLKQSMGEAERGNQLDGHPHSSPGLTPIFVVVVFVLLLGSVTTIALEVQTVQISK